MAKQTYGRALTREEASSGQYTKDQVVRVGKGLFFRDPSLEPPVPPKDLLGIYQTVFGPDAGQALFNSLQPPTPNSADTLSTGFNNLFHPFFQQQQDLYNQQYQTGITRGTEDYNTNLDQFNQQAGIANQNAIGQYNQQYGDAFGSPMQMQAEALRQQDLERQKTLLQRNFSRNQYDLGQLNQQNLNSLQNQQDTAKADYFSQNQFSNILG